MFIKLNFKTATQIPTIFSAIYYILKNKSSYSAGNSGITNAINFYNNVNGNVSSPETLLVSNLGNFDINITTNVINCEIWNTNIGTLPECYYYSAATPSLTFRFPVYDAPNTITYSKLTPTAYQTSTTVSPTWPTTGSPPVATTTTSTTTDIVTATGSNYTSLQAWSDSASRSYYSFWIYITPTGIIWSASTVYSKYGWPATTGNLTNNNIFGPFMIGQYTRLDVWNTDSNGVIPVFYSNGYLATYRPYYGISYQYDIGWGNFTNSYNFNPLYTNTIPNTTFSVLNIVDATPNQSGTWSVTNSSNTIVKVGWGTNIRSWQDQTSLATTTNNKNTPASSAYTWTNTSYNSANSNFKTTQVDGATAISAFHGPQGAALYPKEIFPPLTLAITTSTITDYYRWPTASSNPSGSFALHPIVWNAVHLNVIGGLISDKTGVFLFNGDYLVGDEFTVSSTGITYSIWPLADGFYNRIGLAVPKR